MLNGLLEWVVPFQRFSVRSSQSNSLTKWVFNVLSRGMGLLVILIGFLALLDSITPAGFQHSLAWFQGVEYHMALPKIMAFMVVGILLLVMNLDGQPSRFQYWVWTGLTMIPFSLAIIIFGRYLIAAQFSFSRLMFHSYPHIHMSFSTVMEFLLVTISLFILLNHRRVHSFWVTHGIGMISLFLFYFSMYALIGHGHNIPILFGYIQPIPSSWAFLALSLGLWFKTISLPGVKVPFVSRYSRVKWLCGVSLVVSATIFIVVFHVLVQLIHSAFPAVSTQEEVLLFLLEYLIIGVAIILNVLSVRGLHYLDQSLQAQDSLMDQLDFIQAVTTSLGEGICAVDQCGRITYLNPAGEQLLGWSQVEIEGMLFRKLVQPEANAEHQTDLVCPLREEFDSAQPCRDSELLFIRKGGTIFPVSCTSSALLDKRGKRIGALFAFQDISERKHAEQVVRESQAEVLKAHQAAELAETESQKRSLFFAVMSHELRTPLNSIIGFTEMFLSGYAGELNDKQIKYLQNITVSSEHLLHMVNDILDLAKIEAGRLSIYPEKVDLRALIHEIQCIVAPLAEQKQVTLHYDLDPDVEVVEVDPTRLKQILLNLLSNAIKFNLPHGHVELSMFHSEDDKNLVCRVRDTGIGICKSRQENLFTEFYQSAPGCFDKQEGTGLGLALSKKLVELHGGSIEVESEEGLGATFTFRFPRVQNPVESILVLETSYVSEMKAS